MAKRTIDSFFRPQLPGSCSLANTSKKIKTDGALPRRRSSNDASSSGLAQAANSPSKSSEVVSARHHPIYPTPIAGLPSHISIELLHGTPLASPQVINNQPHLDLLYFQPFLSAATARELFAFFRRELPFYRVQYKIRRGSVETQITTPRFTTVFGVDETSRFAVSTFCPPACSDDGNGTEFDPTNSMVLKDRRTNTPVSTAKYKHRPRPIPACLDLLRQRVEAATADGTTYNFCLVNYYATGEDSISYHSDDERFLGPNPTIASLSLGAQRDFLLKHKPHTSAGSAKQERISLPGMEGQKPLKYSLSAGDLMIMRGQTQSNWLHSIPKRKTGDAHKGRINITFRKAVVPAGTDNYYTYNVGSGMLYRWNESMGQMIPISETRPSGSSSSD